MIRALDGCDELLAEERVMGVIVETSEGQIEGVQRGSHQAFLGVPFAKPPVGGLRWRAPEAAERWDGVRDASAFGNAAAQPDHPIPGFPDSRRAGRGARIVCI